MVCTSRELALGQGSYGVWAILTES
jgi:hypothetical protein